MGTGLRLLDRLVSRLDESSADQSIIAPIADRHLQLYRPVCLIVIT